MPENCRECLQEQIDNNVPLFLRRENHYPCEIHGNPADISARDLAWLQLYEWVRESSEIRTFEDAKSKKPKAHCVLNVAVLKILSEEIGLNFLEAFSMLTLINKAFNEG